MITQTKLKHYLNYNPDTGIFTWKNPPTNSVKRGGIAGHTDADQGYVHIQLENKRYKAHRLAWLFEYGYFPEHEVEHQNGICNNNWIDNLREATHSCNMQNKCKDSRNISGFPGVSYYKPTDKWRAKIQLHGQVIHLGYYTSPLEAALVRFTAEVWDNRWHCHYRSVLNRAIKKAWSAFNCESSC